VKPVRVGCSGWNYRDWRGCLYPPGTPARRWLETYAGRFDTVEVNATFYRLATRGTVEHWVEQTAEGLWQLPESFHRDEHTLGHLLDRLPGGRHAIELRHPSWFVKNVYELLRAHDVALVLGDHPQRPFQTHQATASWRYIRFHYGTRGRRGNYSHTELEEWAQQLHRWRSTHEMLVYFNNDWEGFAPNNALWLQRRLTQLASAN
jgi:uncharacterized protein YecE (DUF72 family)